MFNRVRNVSLKFLILSRLKLLIFSLYSFGLWLIHVFYCSDLLQKIRYWYIYYNTNDQTDSHALLAGFSLLVIEQNLSRI